MSIKEKFLKCINKIFPENIKCQFCSSENFDDRKPLVCDECLSKLAHISKGCMKCGVEILDMAEICDVCKEYKPEFCRAVAPFNYDDFTKPLIYKFKYDNAKYLAEPFSEFMLKTLKEADIDFDVIVPVPLSLKREKLRGYNQSQLLANKLAEKLNVPVVCDCVVKKLDTANQASLGFLERTKNLEGSFEVVNRDAIFKKKVLLVDDVFTTGATANEVSKVLKKSGVKLVYVVTFAHTPFNKNR